MAFAYNKQLSIAEDGTGTDFTVAVNPAIDISGVDNVGYEASIGAGAGFTANLEASVNGNVWTVITALGSSAQGALGDHYNFARVNVSVQGAHDGSKVWICGREV